MSFSCVAKLALGALIRLLLSLHGRSRRRQPRGTLLLRDSAAQRREAAVGVPSADLRSGSCRHGIPSGVSIRSWMRRSEASTHGSTRRLNYCPEQSRAEEIRRAVPSWLRFVKRPLFLLGRSFVNRLHQALITGRPVDPNMSNRLAQTWPDQVMGNAHGGFPARRYSSSGSGSGSGSGSPSGRTPESSSSLVEERCSPVKEEPEQYLPAMVEAENNAFAEADSAFPGNRELRTAIVGFCISVAVALLFGRREVIPYTGRCHQILLPPMLERMLGNHEFRKQKQLWREWLLPPDHPKSVRVKRVLERLLSAMEAEPQLREDEGGLSGGPTKYLRDLEWEVVVVNNFVCNASAMRGGKIFVESGILSLAETDEELAMILGHEMGHVIARHLAEDLATYVLWIPPLVYLLAALGVRDTLAGNALTYLFLSPLSRREEVEADRIGLMLSSAAGYDPRMATKFFRHLNYYSKWHDFTDTHPCGETREKHLSEPKIMKEAITRYDAANKP